MPPGNLGLLRRPRRIAKAVFEAIAALPEPLADMDLAMAVAAEPEPMRGDLLRRLADLSPATQGDLLAYCRRARSRPRIQAEIWLACFGPKAFEDLTGLLPPLTAR